MAHRIFISLNHRDDGLARALRDALDSIFGESFEIWFSTSKELEGGIRSGEDWFQWIVTQVTECDKAFVLITSNSIQAPWLMWESGAVYGAAIASGEGGYGKVWPIVYQLKSEEIPSPIRDSKAQYRYGYKKKDVKQLILELFDEYKKDLRGDAFGKLTDLNEVLDTYEQTVRRVLLNAPALPTGTILDEWRQRVERLGENNRASEVKQLQHWMEVSFGHEQEGEPQPVDLSIHVQLGELYAKNRDYRNAIAQFKLARRLASRDVLVLRQLGRFYLEDKQLGEARAVIDRIGELDPAAFEKNAECAALLGRFHRESGDIRKAAESYSAALPSNPQSYYLANVTAEAYLELGDTENAKSFFQQALSILDKISDRNVWTVATRANALTAIGDLDAASDALGSLEDYNPTQDEMQTISEGLSGIAEKLDPKPDIRPLLKQIG